jgi:CHAT domain-containing protein
MVNKEKGVVLRSETPGLVAKVIELVRSETDADKRRLLEKYPELLSDDGLDVLSQIATAHGANGDSQSADSVNGLRFMLERMKLHGFDHAALEQLIFAAVMRLPDDRRNRTAYLENITTQYPELLQEKADAAIAVMQKDWPEFKAPLDVLLEKIKRQRSRRAAMGKGNKALPRRVRREERIASETVEPGVEKADLKAIAAKLRPADWSMSKSDLMTFLVRIASCRDVEAVIQVTKDYRTVVANLALLEKLTFATRGDENLRWVLRILWEYGERFAAPCNPPPALETVWSQLQNVLQKLDESPLSPRRSTDLGRAIKLGARLIRHKDFDDGDECFRRRVLEDTGLALFARGQSAQAEQRFDAALTDFTNASHQLYEASLLARAGSPSFARLMTNSGLVLNCKYALSHEPDDLETAILVLEQAVANHENHRPSLVFEAGVALVDAYVDSIIAGSGEKYDEQKLSDAAEALSYILLQSAHELADELDVSAQGASQGVSPGSIPKWLRGAITLSRLNYFLFGGDRIEPLECVARSLDQVIDRYPTLRPAFIHPLCDILREIFERSGNLALLNRAITDLSNTVASSDARQATYGYPNLSLCLHLLGTTLRERAIATDSKDDISQAVEVHRRAMESEATDSSLFPTLLDDYAVSLRRYFEVTQDEAALNKAIALSNRAIALLGEDDPDRDAVLQNLVNHLSTRGSRRRRRKDIDRALKLCEARLAQPIDEGVRRSLQACLFTTRLLRFQTFGVDADLAKAKTIWTEHVRRHAGPAQRFKYANSLSLALFRAGQFESGAEVFADAREAVFDLVFGAETRAQGKADWLAEFQWLVVVAAYSLAHCGRAEDAVREIESCLALLLQEASWTRPSVLDELTQAGRTDLRTRLEEATRRLGYLSAAGASRFVEIDAARRAYRSARDELHALPEFSDLVRPPDLGAIGEALGPGGVAAYLLVTSYGALTLMADGAGVEALWSEAPTQEDVARLNYGERANELKGASYERQLAEMGGWFGAYLRRREALLTAANAEESLAAWRSQIEELVTAVEAPLIAPLARAVRARNAVRLVLVPLTTLSWWPLHAASRRAKNGETIYPLQGIRTGYVPSVLTCSRLRGPPEASARRRVLAIGSPEHAEWAALKYTAAEVGLAAEILPDSITLLGPKASVAEFVKSAPKTTIWHFAGHAFFSGRDGDEPASVFAQGELLKLSDIQALKVSPPRLVVLSACESALFDPALANERRSLATAFLELGAWSVVATLWPVDDFASLLFMAYFYAELARSSPSEALTAAQQWMRGTTDGEKKRWVGQRLRDQSWSEHARSGLMSLYRDLALRDERDRHYAHPYYWAGYAIYGLEEAS